MVVQVQLDGGTAGHSDKDRFSGSKLTRTYSSAGLQDFSWQEKYSWSERYSW